MPDRWAFKSASPQLESEQIGVPDPQGRATTGFAIHMRLLQMRRAGSSCTPRGQELDCYVDRICDLLIHDTVPKGTLED